MEYIVSYSGPATLQVEEGIYSQLKEGVCCIFEALSLFVCFFLSFVCWRKGRGG